jgi:hypothetical protein
VSQYGIGAVIARLTEAVLRHDGMVAPVGSWQKKQLTLSVPSIIGANGGEAVLQPSLTRSTRPCRRASRRYGPIRRRERDLAPGRFVLAHVLVVYAHILTQSGLREARLVHSFVDLNPLHAMDTAKLVGLAARKSRHEFDSSVLRE